MESESTSEGLETQVSGLSSRLKALEAKVSTLNLAQEQDKKHLDEIQQFSKKVAAQQEQKLAEIEENLKEQKKLLGEMRIHLQNLQNSRVNHKDILVKHENQTKKLIELVNEISERLHQIEMETKWIAEAKARRFSTFEGKGRKVRGEDLYDFDDGSSGRRSGRGHRRSHHQHRKVQSFPVERERRKSTSRRLTNEF